jgi:hypothetical protein
MILTLAKFISGLFGIDLQKAQRYVIYAVMIVIAIIVLVFAMWMRSCFTKTPKLNEAEIQKAQQSIAVEDRKQMVDILANSDAREAAIDGNISNAKANTINAIHDSREKWSKASDDEIKAELMRRMNQ